MSELVIGRPADHEYGTYFSPYVKFVPNGDIIDILTQQHQRTLDKFRSLTPEQWQTRLPAETDWNVAEVLGHLVDVENLMLFRAVTISRNPEQELFGIDQDAYVRKAEFANLPSADLLDLYDNQRRTTLAYARIFPPSVWMQLGIAGGKRISVRALFYVIAGHELWHLTSLQHSYKL
jgi:hypothetical protein